MKSNNLINEKSPYLLQHAHNPVNWYSWSEAAFEKARSENKPIFLSIGYSSCYWCHVMEREVFENEDIAKLMNEYFINIKVDREERPDIDRVYMTALQAMTGSGGWPMSMFLTPDLNPFYGGTYIPPKAKYGRAGFEDVIEQIHNVWKEKESEVVESGSRIVEQLKDIVESGVKSKSGLNEEITDNAFRVIRKYYDEEYGGFGKGNKFPRPVVFDFLLEYHYYKKEFKALDMVTYTLKKMYEGGMYDHLGGGFHRYSVDHFWRVPHFEKMLYDQAQLVVTYLNTFLITKNKFYLFVAEDTLRYCKSNLKNPSGGFYSAEDAESFPDANSDEKEEGAYYLWDNDELKEILADEEYKIMFQYFGIQNHGNTVNDPHGVFGRKNVLFLAKDVFDIAKNLNKTPEETGKIIDTAKSKLLSHRNKRPKPFLDDKILTSWNGLMISALSKAYQITGKKEYLEFAKETVNFIRENLYEKDSKKLLHRYRDGESRYEGTLEDYAYLISGLIDLYESCFHTEYMEFALELNNTILKNLYDNVKGGFFDVMPEASDVILRTKDIYDGSEPSGNSVQILNLLRLEFFTGNKSFHEKAETCLNLFSGEMERMPYSSPLLLNALNLYLHSAKEIVFKGNTDKAPLKELLEFVNTKYLPDKVQIKADKEFVKISEFVSNVLNDGNENKVYVCENFKCNMPVDNENDLEKLLG